MIRGYAVDAIFNNVCNVGFDYTNDNMHSLKTGIGKYIHLYFRCYLMYVLGKYNAV